MSKTALSKTTALVLVFLLILLVPFISSSYAVDWGLETRLTYDPPSVTWWDMAPSITQTSDGKVWVVWHSDRADSNNEIFYKTYDGSVWSDDVQLTFNPQSDLNPSIMQASDGKVWVVWDTDRNLLDEDIYYKTFDGVSWTADIPLVTALGPDKNPSMTQTADGKIWVVWSAIRTGDSEVYYKVFDGATWSNDTQLTTDHVFEDENPAILQANDGRIWVVWSKASNSKKGDIYYKTFDGVAWSAEVQLTTDTYDDVNPSIMQAMNGRIWVAWDSNRKANNRNIYYNIFDGYSWSGDTQLTIAMEDDKTPAITQTSDASIWIVWASKRVGPQFDIYYQVGMEHHDVAVLEVAYYASHNTTAFRGETVYVEVGVQNDGEAMEAIEVRCYANSSLIGSRAVSLASGQYYSMVFGWNTIGVRPGPYVISAEVLPVLGETDLSDNSFIGGTVEVRIKGDIVGEYGGVILPVPDRKVDIDDFSIPVGHYGCQQPWQHLTWDPVADVTEDGKIDIDDIMEVGAHFGQT